MEIVTVFGASGRMGQAQVRQLLLAGYQVRAITRKKGLFSLFRPSTIFWYNFHFESID